MVQLPISGRGQPRFGDVHGNREEGAYGIDELPRYRSPKMANAVTIPTAFFLNGWIHALTNREIAMWLMLRDLTVRANRPADTTATPDVQINAKTRLRGHDLSLATWRSHLELEAFGLSMSSGTPIAAKTAQLSTANVRPHTGSASATRAYTNAPRSIASSKRWKTPTAQARGRV